MSRIKPLNDFILLERRDADKLTAGGIHLPDSAKRPDVIECRVVAVGPGGLEHLVTLDASPSVLDSRCYDRVMPVKVGDVILVCEGALHAAEHAGAKMFFTQVAAVMGVIEAD